MKFDVATIMLIQKMATDAYLTYRAIQKDHAELKPPAQLFSEADAIATGTIDKLQADKAKHP